ncbi:MAG: methyltransferase domain-containing protein [Leptospiraceae bacterium]|nr:methyltransferase domain-containing protein [Leptospiraceae bacterium]MCP5503207.1 methyltransferase domain-containing protein [Leptospiraceae bacterium]
MKLYKDLAEYYYQIESPGRNFSNEVTFIQSLLDKMGIKSLLDMGCGTGEHINALQNFGFTCHGIDSSPEMIKTAQKRFPQGQFEIGDIRSFIAARQFECISCLFGTFNYLIEDKDISFALRNIWKNLGRSGLFLLEVWNAFPIQQIQRKPITTVSTSRIGETIIQRNRGFRLKEDPNQEKILVEVNFVYNLDEKVIKDRHIMRVFYEEQITKLLEEHKFRILKVFGNYLQKPFAQTDSRMVILALKQ